MFLILIGLTSCVISFPVYYNYSLFHFQLIPICFIFSLLFFFNHNCHDCSLLMTLNKRGTQFLSNLTCQRKNQKNIFDAYYQCCSHSHTPACNQFCKLYIRPNSKYYLTEDTNIHTLTPLFESQYTQILSFTPPHTFFFFLSFLSTRTTDLSHTHTDPTINHSSVTHPGTLHNLGQLFAIIMIIVYYVLDIWP